MSERNTMDRTREGEDEQARGTKRREKREGGQEKTSRIPILVHKTRNRYVDDATVLVQITKSQKSYEYVWTMQWKQNQSLRLCLLLAKSMITKAVVLRRP